MSGPRSNGSGLHYDGRKAGELQREPDGAISTAHIDDQAGRGVMSDDRLDNGVAMTKPNDEFFNAANSAWASIGYETHSA